VIVVAFLIALAITVVATTVPARTRGTAALVLAVQVVVFLGLVGWLIAEGESGLIVPLGMAVLGPALLINARRASRSRQDEPERQDG
jgi:TRAP-type C4-dicarboxylate transport system permease small subunit